MFDKDLIPFVGDKTVRERMRELDNEMFSLMVIIGIGFSKIFEGVISILVEEFPITALGIDFSSFVWWTVYTLFWAILFLFEADKTFMEKAEDAGEKAGDVKEKAEEVKENVEEKVSDDD